LTSGRKIFVGGGLTGLAAIIAAWVAIGVGGGGGQSGLSTCPLPAYPSASCTGVPAGTTLTPVTGNYDGNTTNEVIDGLDVSGCFVIHAAGVTIKNSKANCIKVGDSGDASRSGTPLEIEDSEVDCDDGSQGNFTGIFPENFKVYRTNIHNCENGASVGDYAEFHDSYIHDLFQCPIAGCPEPGSPHTDGIEFEVGAGSVIAHNTIYAFNPPCSPGNNGTCNGTSAININNVAGGNSLHSDNIMIRDNLIGGGSYSIYCPIHGVQPSPVNFRIINNHFTTALSSTGGESGPTTACADDEIASGNVYDPGGDPVEIG
jgi:hypothetical protein